MAVLSTGLALFMFLAVFRDNHIEAAISWTTPAGGNAEASNSISEETTTAVTAETVVTSGGTGTMTYAVYSQDGSTTAADFKFEFDGAVLKSKASAGFDYETKHSYKILFTAVDSASPPLTATGTLTALIADYDEFTPDFTGISTCGAIESTSLENAVVGNYMPADKDGSAAARFPNFPITSGDDSNQFIFDSNGILKRTAVALDKSAKSVYTLKAEARGPQKTGTITIIVTLDGSCNSATRMFTSALTLLISLSAFLLYRII